jgi:hypothetical protein
VLRRRQVHLNAFLHVDGHHGSGWRRPGLDPVQAQRFSHYLHVAQRAERGKFDSVFLADNLACRTTPSSVRTARSNRSPCWPRSATGTTHIGLIATASATYYAPFHLARLLASVDAISGGRAGWNIVTSAYLAHNFGPGYAGTAMGTLSFPTSIRGISGGCTQAITRVGGITGAYLFPVLTGAHGQQFTIGAIALAPVIAVAAILAIHWDPIGRDVELP